MRFAMVGAGSLGQVYAGLLREAGHEVVLLARGDTAQTLRTHGVVVRGLRDVATPVSVVERPAEIGQCDLLLVCTKAIATREMLRALADVPAQVVASVQNGVLKDRLLAEIFGDERVVGAATMVGAARRRDGTVLYTSSGTTYFGELDGSVTHRVRAIEASLREADLAVEVVTDIARLEWSKACLALAAFSASCFTRRPVAELYVDPEAAAAMLEMMREVTAVARAAGPGVGDYPGLRAESWVTGPRTTVLAAMAESGRRMQAAGPVTRVSMLQDLLAGRPLEVEEVFGFVQLEAERLGIDVPRLQWAVRLLRALDPARRPPDMR